MIVGKQEFYNKTFPRHVNRPSGSAHAGALILKLPERDQVSNENYQEGIFLAIRMNQFNKLI